METRTDLAYPESAGLLCDVCHKEGDLIPVAIRWYHRECLEALDDCPACQGEGCEECCMGCETCVPPCECCGERH